MYNQFMKIEKWHQRYKDQADWTKEVRETFFKETNVKKDNLILEVGCGTGVIIEEFQKLGYSNIIGIDIDLDSLNFAKNKLNKINLIGADVHYLPFNSNTFDVVYCHYLLLWVCKPKKAIKEMVRILKSGGKLMIFAEPDYYLMENSSLKLNEIQNIQAISLKKQGANPFFGHQLQDILIGSGLKNIYVDQIKFGMISNNNQTSEIDIFLHDLSFTNYSKEQLDEYEKIIVKNKEYRVSTFYGIGFKE